MVGWSGQNRGLKADSCGFQKLSVVYSNSKNSGGQTHPKFAPKTMKPCQQTKTPLWVRSRPLDSPESEFNVRKSQDDGLPLEPCAISGGGCLTTPLILLRPSLVSIRGTAINCEYGNLIGTFSSETFHWLWKSGKKIRFGSRSGPGQILHVSFFPFFLVFVYNGGSIVINWPSL